MLVRECFSESRRDEQGKPYTFNGERMVEVSDVVTPEQRAPVEAAEIQAAQAATGNDLTLRQQAEAALVDLRAYRDAPTTTNAQDKAAIKLLVRVAIGLIRLALRKLDAAD